MMDLAFSMGISLSQKIEFRLFVCCARDGERELEEKEIERDMFFSLTFALPQKTS